MLDVIDDVLDAVKGNPKNETPTKVPDSKTPPKKGGLLDVIDDVVQDIKSGNVKEVVNDIKEVVNNVKGKTNPKTTNSTVEKPVVVDNGGKIKAKSKIKE